VKQMLQLLKDEKTKEATPKFCFSRYKKTHFLFC